VPPATCHLPPATAPPLSVIVPAYNAAATLAECLEALAGVCGPGDEILVVDDGSTDATAEIARQAGARVVETHGRGGPAAARNLGARETSGEILFFVDADVVVHTEAVRRVRAALEGDAAAVFGSYDDHPRASGIISRYRNLLHHWTHQQATGEPNTFWAGLGAVRRRAFEAVGGFDEARYPVPSIEDIELGYRLRKAGFRIELDKQLQGAHLKRWTLSGVIRTDVTCRAIPWTRLLRERDLRSFDLNLDLRQRIAGGLTLLSAVSVPAAVWRPEILWLTAALLLPVLWINRALYAFFARTGGPAFAAACVPLHLLYYLYSTLSYAYVLLTPARR
jgi:glycosyltransferase involved in cell wall biosynthesis